MLSWQYCNLASPQTASEGFSRRQQRTSSVGRSIRTRAFHGTLLLSLAGAVAVLSTRIAELPSSIEFNQLWIGNSTNFFNYVDSMWAKTNQLGNLKFKEVWNLCALVWITPNLPESDPNWGMRCPERYTYVVGWSTTRQPYGMLAAWIE